MRHTRRVAAALTVGLLLLTACANDDGNDDAEPIGGEEVEADPVDAEEDEADEEDDEPFAVPDEIDEDYAEDVINALLEINTEILITALQQDQGETLDHHAADRLHAITDGDRRELQMQRLQAYIDDPANRDGLVPAEEMSATHLEVDAVIHAEPDHCLLVGGFWNLGGTAEAPPGEDMKTVFSLSRLDRGVTEIERNPTPWKIHDMSPLRDGNNEPIPPDQWDEINFPDDFDHTCQEL